MRAIKNHRGFTLIEMAVVIGIVGILAGISLRLVGHIRFYNIEKTTQYIADALTKQQMRNMSKENRIYLYIFEVDGKYYSCLSEAATCDRGPMKAQGKEIGSGVVIQYNDGTNTKTIEGGETLRISYKKDGTFKECPAYILITKSGAARKIVLNKLTGKHVISTE